jgi:hypothetical protein
MFQRRRNRGCPLVPLVPLAPLVSLSLLARTGREDEA